MVVLIYVAIEKDTEIKTASFPNFGFTIWKESNI